MAAKSSWDLFNANELRVYGNPSFENGVGVQDMLGNMHSLTPFFK